MLTMKSRFFMAAASLLLTLTACNADEASKSAKPAASNDKAAIVVNGTPISQSRIDVLVKDRVAQGQPSSPELLKNIKEDLITREIIVQEATKKGLQNDPEIMTQMDLVKQGVLVRAYIQDYIKNNPVSDDALKAEYDKIKAQMGDKEYKVRHILVGSEQEAKAIIDQLKKGGKFEKLATEKSKDPGSKAKGGDLDWISLAAVVKPFGEALKELKKGQYTATPVQSQFGWHVIKLEDTRPVQAPPFDEVKNTLRQRMQQQQAEKAVLALRSNAKVEDKTASAPPPPAPAATPAGQK